MEFGNHLMPQRSGIDSHLQLIPERNRRSMPFNLSIGHEPNVTGAGPAILQGNYVPRTSARRRRRAS